MSNVGIKGEASGLYAKSNLYSDLRFSGYSLMGGPQITGRTRPVSAFMHALVGVEHLGGGLDWHRGIDHTEVA